jgi:hypothetical protein
VSQPREAQFLIYEVPQAMAARFDCASRLTPGGPTSGRATGQHFVATFNIAGSEKGASLALLWVREGEFWKIVSWRTAERRDDTPVAAAPPEPELVRIAADLTLVNAAHDFVESWLVRKNDDAAFGYLSTSSYGCYDILRGPDAPASTSLADAGRRTRGSLERIGAWVSTSPNLEAIIEAAEPLHPSIRVMDQPHSRLFSLTSVPSALGEAVACDARARGTVPPDPLPLVYGDVFGMTFRFRTQDGEAPVLRLLWRKRKRGRGESRRMT